MYLQNWNIYENSTSTGQGYKNLVDALKSHGDTALPTLLDITNNEGISQTYKLSYCCY